MFIAAVGVTTTVMGVIWLVWRIVA